MSIRQQNFRQSELLPIAGTGASANGMAYTNSGPNTPGANPLSGMRYYNPTGSIAYAITGRGTATATVPTPGTSSPMTPIGPGVDAVFDVDPMHNFVSVIFGTSTTTGTFFAAPGEGS